MQHAVGTPGACSEVAGVLLALFRKPCAPQLQRFGKSHSCSALLACPSDGAAELCSFGTDSFWKCGAWSLGSLSGGCLEHVSEQGIQTISKILNYTYRKKTLHCHPHPAMGRFVGKSLMPRQISAPALFLLGSSSQHLKNPGVKTQA